MISQSYVGQNIWTAVYLINSKYKSQEMSVFSPVNPAENGEFFIGLQDKGSSRNYSWQNVKHISTADLWWDWWPCVLLPGPSEPDRQRRQLLGASSWPGAPASSGTGSRIFVSLMGIITTLTVLCTHNKMQLHRAADPPRPMLHPTPRGTGDSVCCTRPDCRLTGSAHTECSASVLTSFQSGRPGTTN